MYDLTQQIIQNWKDQSSPEKESLKQILKKLRNLNRHEVNGIMHKNTQKVFDQFDCLQCANCCKTTPPIFTNRDVKRIARYLKVPPKTFKRKYLIEDLDRTLVGSRIPCVFLEKDNSCSIYTVRPEACRSFPHTDDEKFVFRAELNYKNTQICPAAYSIVKKLPF